MNTATTPPISQAMILAAGKGTRLRPLTLEMPKPLVKVGGQPLIVWHIKALRAAGIEYITINTSWLSDKLMSALGDGSDYGVRLRWSIEDNEPLETAGGIAYALDQGQLDDAPFLLVNGDVWSDVNFLPLTSHKLDAGKLAHLLLVDNPEHHPKGDFAIQNGMATTTPLLESQDKLTFAGISVMTPELVQDVVVGQPASLAPLLQKNMLKLKITASKLDAQWVDVGTLERLKTINQKLDLGQGLQHSGRP